MEKLLARRVLRYGLGILWLVDALLQMQPDMFTSDFYALYPSSIMNSTLQQVYEDQPKWLQAVMHWGFSPWSQHPITFNVFAILMQMTIGASLLLAANQRLMKVAIWLSLFWGSVVWIFGEGMGSLFAGGESFFEGFPGAALLYIIAGILLLIGERAWTNGSIRKGLFWGLGFYWLGMVVYQAWPNSVYWQASGLMGVFANSSSLPQPYILALPVQSFAFAVHAHPIVWNGLFLVLMTVMGVLAFVEKKRHLYLWLTVVWLFWSWWYAQDFGGIFSGLGTDVNTAPVLAIFAITAWIAPRHTDGEMTSI